jgi:hypothetical protein
LPVNYDHTLSSMIIASEQDIVSGDIEDTRQFNLKGRGLVNKSAQLFVLPAAASNPSIETYYPEGYVAAMIEDLLVFARLNRHVQKDSPVFATGSPIIKEGRRFYPCLDTISNGKETFRRVRLRCDSVFTPGTKFLLIKQ